MTTRDCLMMRRLFRLAGGRPPHHGGRAAGTGTASRPPGTREHGGRGPSGRAGHGRPSLLRERS
ncbi:hypothetical protein [Deinococcus planocerae]|uniref:hypothetical protein n=1 Tax=Deinococcus planocerae TaxID=1737569 RepID=UPI0011AF8FAF|nr:hypothetical protein [Deinococcus planocerae]